MQLHTAIFLLLSAATCGHAAPATPKPTLTFSLAATNGYFARNIGERMRLRVERDELGWEVCVYKKGSADNLLMPRGNWHGLQPCQIHAWLPGTSAIPTESVIPIPQTKLSVRIRLAGATTAGSKAGDQKFTGGRADVFVEPQRNRTSGLSQ